MNIGEFLSPDDTIELLVLAESGLLLVIPGLVLSGSLLMRAFCATANVVCVSGFVNRITP